MTSENETKLKNFIVILEHPPNKEGSLSYLEIYNIILTSRSGLTDTIFILTSKLFSIYFTYF